MAVVHRHGPPRRGPARSPWGRPAPARCRVLHHGGRPARCHAGAFGTARDRGALPRPASDERGGPVDRGAGATHRCGGSCRPDRVPRRPPATARARPGPRTRGIGRTAARGTALGRRARDRSRGHRRASPGPRTGPGPIERAVRRRGDPRGHGRHRPPARLRRGLLPGERVATWSARTHRCSGCRRDGSCSRR